MPGIPPPIPACECPASSSGSSAITHSVVNNIEAIEAAFSIAPGSYSKKPVKTQFGWHVIKVEERRDSPKPDFASVRPQIEQKLRQDTAMKLFADWKGQADVKQFDINGNPVAKTDAAE